MSIKYRTDGAGAVEIVSYIEKNLKKNYKLNDIEIALLRQGYSKTVVDNAMKVVEMSMSKAKAEALKEEQKKAEVKLPEVVEPEKKKGFFSRLFGL